MDRLTVASHRLHALAHKDSLTETANRLSFDRRLTDLHQKVEIFSLILLDIDHFKTINDTHGHGAGDMVLTKVAEVLRQSIRAHDMVARIGGEEFALLLPATDGKKASAIAERIRASLEAAEVVIDHRRITFTASFGVTASAPPHDLPDSLKRAADGALYAAKHGGRNRVCCAGC